jgi:hypothetical protein
MWSSNCRVITEAFNLDGDYPSSVTHLCEPSFSSCGSISSISFESGSNLHQIDKSAFSFSGLTTMVIPNGIYFIDGSAFGDCSLKSLSISSGVGDFCALGSFLADSSRCVIVRCFGSINSVVIPSSVTH